MVRPSRSLLTVVAVMVVLVAACSSSDSAEPPTTAAPSPALGKAASEPFVPAADLLEVNVVGDWLPNPGPFVDQPQYGRVTGPIVDRFQDDDLTVANLQCVVSSDAPRREGLNFAIRCLPADLDELVRAGVDVVTVANDHITDFGSQGVTDTVAAIEAAGMVAVGPGPEPATIETDNGPVTVLAIPRKALFTLSVKESVAAVADAAEPDVPLVVSVHWGEPGARAATRADNELAESMVEAGADVVMGHGAARVHSFRRLGEAAVFMGLGRIVWPVDDLESAETDTAVGTVWMDGTDLAEACLLPATLGSNGGPALDHRDPGCR
ncbi:MAG: CapA family protein [Acidimicrobiales bacterium]